MQQEYFGRGSSEHLLKSLSSLGIKRPLLVTGRDSYRNCGASACFEKLLASYDRSYFNEFHPNPTFDDVLAGARLCQQVGADVLVAIGGGSAIDVAKSIAAFNTQPGQERAVALGEHPLGDSVLPIIAIPTTAGTGSESTHFAVIYVDGKKFSLADPRLMPTASILDPVYTDGLPPYITACTGFDAMCQAVESYWAVGATAESRSFSEQAIPVLKTNLVQVVNNPSNDSRDNILRAANYAGRAINISKTTAPHALSYTITSLYGIPHGHAAAMTLGAFFPFHDLREGAVLSSKLSRTDFVETQARLLELLGVDSADGAKAMWYQLMQDCGLGLRVADYDIAHSPDLEKIVAGVNLERLGNHPVEFSSAQLVEILRSIPSTEEK